MFFSFRWSFLKINGSKTVVDDMALAKAAGMAEGAATGIYGVLQYPFSVVVLRHSFP